MVENSELQSHSDLFALIRTHIEVHKTRIDKEIRSYPMPIPACDAQYNFLLEERGSINQELKQLHTLSMEQRVSIEPPDTLRVFINTSSYIHHEFRQELSALTWEK